MDGEWRVSGGGSSAGSSKRGKTSKALKSPDFAEASAFSVLADMDEGAGLAAPKPRRHSDRKGGEAPGAPRKAKTKAQLRAEELAALHKTDRRAGKSVKVSRRGVKDGEFVGEVVVLRKSAEEVQKEQRRAAERAAAEAAEKKRAEKREAAKAAAKTAGAKEQQSSKKKSKKGESTAAAAAKRPAPSRVLTVDDVARMVDALESSGTEARFRLLAVCQELDTPARVADPAAVHARLAAWVARCDAADVAGFFRARIECLARDAPRADAQVAPGEQALLRAVAATSPDAVAAALLAHRDVLQRSRGLLGYAAALLRVLAPVAPCLARTAWAAYAATAASRSAAAATLLADTAAALCEAQVGPEEKGTAGTAGTAGTVALFDEAAVVAHVPGALEAVGARDVPARLRTVGARVLDVRGMYPAGRAASRECVEALLACVARHTAEDDACGALAGAAVVQAVAMQPARGLAVLAEHAAKDAAAVAAVTLSIAQTRAVDWLPAKPLRAYVARLAGAVDAIEGKNKKAALSRALEELKLTIDDPERNKVEVKKEEEEEEEVEKDEVDLKAEEDEEDEDDGEGDEEDEDEENEEDDENDEDDEEEEDEEDEETKKVAKKKDDSSCLTIYAIVVAVLAFVFAGIGTYIVLHCTEYPQCSKYLDVVCPRVRPLCENLQLPYTTFKH